MELTIGQFNQMQRSCKKAAIISVRALLPTMTFVGVILLATIAVGTSHLTQKIAGFVLFTNMFVALAFMLGERIFRLDSSKAAQNRIFLYFVLISGIFWMFQAAEILMQL